MPRHLAVQVIALKAQHLGQPLSDTRESRLQAMELEVRQFATSSMQSSLLSIVNY